MDTSGLPPNAHGDALENLTVKVKVTVTNVGQRAGSVPVMVVYSKLTRGVVRNLRDLAGFTKLHLLPGQSMEVAVPIRLVDLARFDPDMPWTNRKESAVMGAYVVDGGTYGFYAGDCVASGGVYNDMAGCPHKTAQEGTRVQIGSSGQVFGVYL